MAKFWNSPMHQTRKYEKELCNWFWMHRVIWQKGFLWNDLKVLLFFLLGSHKDALIHCFKENSAFWSSANKLKEALQIFCDEWSEKDPFVKLTDLSSILQSFYLADIDEQTDEADIFNCYYNSY